MSTDREQKKRLLLRKAERSRALEPFKQKLIQATGLPSHYFNFMTLEESDPLNTEFHSKYREISDGNKLKITWGEPEPIKQILSDMAGSVEKLEIIIFFPDVDILGAMVMDVDIFLAHAFQLSSAAGDCIHGVSKDFSSGITLDYYEEGRTGITHEILSWGIYRHLLEESVAMRYPQKLIMPSVSGKTSN